MDEREILDRAAPCGIACGACELFVAKDDPALLEAMVARGIPRDRLPCSGCRAVEGRCPVIGGTCETYACIRERGHVFCHECAEFPCAKLQPAADRAQALPHNLKVFNLVLIRRLGPKRFLEAAPAIKAKYYRGKMAVGKGPQEP